MRRSIRVVLSGLILLMVLIMIPSLPARAQSVASGTVQGTVTDPTGAVIVGASAEIQNPVSGFKQVTTTDGTGTFKFTNVPFNPYRLTITQQGFAPGHQDVNVRTTVPISIPVQLSVGSVEQAVNVEAETADLLETIPSDHVDVDRSLINKMPIVDPGGGLSESIIYSTGGVAADGNGFFHPLGDHAQVTFVIDGQPISDQQSKVFSTQLPTSAIQGMELTTGAPAAQFGDKSSLVGTITTRSGLGTNRVFGSAESYYGSFGTVGGGFGLGFGNNKMGNFLAVDGSRSGRFLDTPEFRPFHDIGNNQSFFDRMDFQPSANDIVHLNLFAARNWIQIPNSKDQAGQDQRQRVLTWNIAPGYQHTFNSATLLTINPYIRKDQFNYYPSRDVTQDSPATQSQTRHLLNWGVKADVSWVVSHNNIKVGADLKQTRLLEKFKFGVTDPGFNPVCFDADGNAVTDPGVTDPAQCDGLGFTANDNLQPGLVPFDLTRGGSLFQFRAAKNINQYAVYVQDDITLGSLVLSLGLRGEHYEGVATDSAAEPRAGVAYNVKGTGTVLRGAYTRAFETPFNENLLLSSATGIGGLAANVFGASGIPIQPGRRNQYNLGFEQTLSKYFVLDADYFWKYTDNAYDFSTLLNTTITFPISWKKSKLDGLTGHVSSINLHGFQAYWTFGHTRARYFPPEVGGLVPQSAIATSVFRIDHDQAFQSTTMLRYQHKTAEWVTLSWRYDSGLVVSGVRDVDAATNLTPNQQVTIGFSCNGVKATVDNPITACNGVGKSTLLALPQTGKEDDDHNPDRVMPRHVLNLGIGTDNLTHAEGQKRITASVDIANLTNKVALYNFLSTFSGTHFLQPRTLMGRIGFTF